MILTFVMGFFTTAFVLPLISALSVPSFDAILVALFGEGSIWALAFSLLLILLIAFGVRKAIKDYA
ncbi:hypothetical protein J6TS2_08200 [Heyndrickxia sporothermodurans]|nr:hypothetical protein J6TS2_08200 [Heyndrickxia sporothermodurans]